MREGPSEVEVAAVELLVPPSFGFPEVEMAQESFVRQFTFKREPHDYANAYAQPRGIPAKDLEALRRKLTERSVVRFVGLVCHLVYWTVLRPEFLNLATDDRGAMEGPSDEEREMLFTEVLSCHAQIHAEMRSSGKHVDSVLAPVLHLALRCAIERLFVGAYRWFTLAGPEGELMLATFHEHLAKLFDPQNYHSQFVSATHGDRFTRAPVDLATDRAARLRGRTAATSPTLRALYPAPASPRVRKLLQQTGKLRAPSGQLVHVLGKRAPHFSFASTQSASRETLNLDGAETATVATARASHAPALAQTTLPPVDADAHAKLRVSKEGRTQLLRRLQHHIGHDISRPPGRNAQELAALSRKKYHDLVRKHNATSRDKRASWC